MQLVEVSFAAKILINNFCKKTKSYQFNYFPLIFLMLISVNAIAQISSHEYPPSFYAALPEEAATPLIELPKPNIQELQKKDQEEQAKGLPWRFGFAFPLGLNLENSGRWIKKDRDWLVWRLSLRAKDAISLNLNFDDFHLSKEAKLYFYNADYSDVLGAISEKNNKPNGKFFIRPIFGEILHIELIVPQAQRSENRISIKEYVYGYRDLRSKATKVFNSSGACNININCKEGDLWQEVKRSVVMITTSSNSRICSGTLVNNVRQDSIPYLLTAAHCGVSNSSIFIFNYESDKCNPNTNGILSNSISTANRRAVALNSGSDFDLFELSSRPPAAYNVFYAGWSAINEAAPKSVSIHHPSGDVKKIALNIDSNATSGFFNSNGSTHWMVRNWEKGTTEQGSSGAALFDFNQRVIGQLHGGDASCNLNVQDYYGKFSASWNSDTSAFRQLKAWLDPDDTKTKVLDGLNPNPAAHQTDLQLLYIGGIPNYLCGDSIAPFAMIKNMGSDSIDSIELQLQLDTIDSTIQYNMLKLGRSNLARIDLPKIALSKGLKQLDVSVFPLSGNPDQDSSNNFQSSIFESNDDPIEITFKLKTDNFGEETIWTITSPEGVKIIERGPFSNITGGSTFTEKLCLYDSCSFQLTLFDSQGDGFNIPQFGNGFALITSSLGDTLLFENNFTTDEKTLSFCVPDHLTSVEETDLEAESFSIYPIPVKAGEALTIKSASATQDQYELRLYNPALGMVAFQNSNSGEFLIPQHLVRGIYFLEIRSKETFGSPAVFKKIIVQ